MVLQQRVAVVELLVRSTKKKSLLERSEAETYTRPTLSLRESVTDTSSKEHIS